MSSASACLGSVALCALMDGDLTRAAKALQRLQVFRLRASPARKSNNASSNKSINNTSNDSSNKNKIAMIATSQ